MEFSINAYTTFQVNLSNYIDEKYQSSEVDDDPIETEEVAGGNSKEKKHCA